LVNSKLLLGTAKDNHLTGTKNNDVALAGEGNDKVIGLEGNDMLSGDEGNDIVMGGDGDDTVMGETGNDQLSGGLGNDTLVGGFGHDTLTGGAGKDKFVLNGAGTGMNHITDFSAKEDVFQVAQIDYQVNHKGVLAVGQFHLGAHAAKSGDRFIYNSKSGALFYDADGNGAGKQTQIAQLNGHVSLTNHSIVIV
jgi:Ca2+-binding RTX toxin-like protein